MRDIKSNEKIYIFGNGNKTKREELARKLNDGSFSGVKYLLMEKEFDNIKSNNFLSQERRFYKDSLGGIFFLESNATAYELADFLARKNTKNKKFLIFIWKPGSKDIYPNFIYKNLYPGRFSEDTYMNLPNSKNIKKYKIGFKEYSFDKEDCLNFRVSTYGIPNNLLPEIRGFFENE